MTTNPAPVRLSVRWHFAELLAAHGLNKVTVTNASGMSPNTISAYFAGDLDRFNLSNVEHLLNTVRELTGKDIQLAELFTLHQTDADGEERPAMKAASPDPRPLPPVKPRPTNPHAPKGRPRRVPAPGIRELDPLPALPEIPPLPAATAPNPAKVSAPVVSESGAAFPRPLWPALRHGLGLTIRQISARCGVHNTSVMRATPESMWQSTPTAAQAEQIAEARALIS